MISGVVCGELGAIMLFADVKMVPSVDDLVTRAEICCPGRIKPGYWALTDSFPASAGGSLLAPLSTSGQLRQTRCGCKGPDPRA
jgi:hypothetical protein